MAEKGLSINISKRLGEMLVSSGLITSVQLNRQQAGTSAGA
jgi:hypothetical protein